MKFSSLSEAILFYSRTQTGMDNLPPNGSFIVQTAQYPPNSNYQQPPAPDVITYGKTIWGIGKISSISKPTI